MIHGSFTAGRKKGSKKTEKQKEVATGGRKLYRLCPPLSRRPFSPVSDEAKQK
jgi:hypothetical protein